MTIDASKWLQTDPSFQLYGKRNAILEESLSIQMIVSNDFKWKFWSETSDAYNHLETNLWFNKSKWI